MDRTGGFLTGQVKFSLEVESDELGSGYMLLHIVLNGNECKVKCRPVTWLIVRVGERGHTIISDGRRELNEEEDGAAGRGEGSIRNEWAGRRGDRSEIARGQTLGNIQIRRQAQNRTRHTPRERERGIDTDTDRLSMPSTFLVHYHH
jgi:hypothetical protein